MLRKLKEIDAERMLECMSDNIVNQYMNIDGTKMTINDCLEFIKNSDNTQNFIHYAIVDDEDNWVGTISLKNIDFIKKEAEYAIITSSLVHGKGYAFSATIEILDYAFNKLKLDRIYLNVVKNNIRANKFYQKVGFTLYETKPNVIIIKNNRYLLNWYEYKAEYFTSRR